MTKDFANELRNVLKDTNSFTDSQISNIICFAQGIQIGSGKKTLCNAKQNNQKEVSKQK